MTIHISRQGQGKPLVLFHGWGFDSRIWQPLLPELTQHFQIYCVDLPGFGQTPLMPWQQFKQDLLQLLPQPFIVAGWSLGGLYATRLAIEAPETVLQLINIASSPCFISQKDWPGITMEVFEGFYDNILCNPNEVLRQFILLQARGAKPIPGHDNRVSEQSLQLGLDILKQWDFRDSLHHIKPPSSYIFGRLDAIIPIKTLEVMQKRYPDFEYIYFKKAAHMPFLSQQQEFIRTLKGLIQ